MSVDLNELLHEKIIELSSLLHVMFQLKDKDTTKLESTLRTPSLFVTIHELAKKNGDMAEFIFSAAKDKGIILGDGGELSEKHRKEILEKRSHIDKMIGSYSDNLDDKEYKNLTATFMDYIAVKCEAIPASKDVINPKKFYEMFAAHDLEKSRENFVTLYGVKEFKGKKEIEEIFTKQEILNNIMTKNPTTSSHSRQ